MIYFSISISAGQEAASFGEIFPTKEVPQVQAFFQYSGGAARFDI